MAVTVSPERDTVATPMQRALRESLYAAAISFGLFVLFIGLKTGQNISNELVLTTRWGLLAAVVIATAIGRFLYVAYGQPFLANQKITDVATGLLPASVASRFFQLPAFIVALVAAVVLFAVNSSLVGWVGAEPAGYLQFLRALAVIYVLACVIYYFRGFIHANFTKLGIAALILYPILVVAILSLMSWSFVGGLQGSLKWVDNFGIQILIYVMLAWGLNIVVGLAGLLDLGYVAFYAVGAYAYALLGTQYGLSFWILLPAAGAMAAFWGVLLGFPVLRLRGDYLA
ncbi:MAG: DUF3382 domain-containing protein, partial [Mesorhizobium sp.]